MTPDADAWAGLTAALGLVDLKAGEAFDVATPLLAGTVIDPGIAEFPNLLLRIIAPAPGIANLFPMPMGGMVLLTARFFLYGRPAPEAAAAGLEAAWGAWLAQRFPA
jgi:hypothetical protein